MSSDLISRKALLEDGFLGLITCNAVRNAPAVHDAVVITRCIGCVCFVPDCMTRNPKGFDDVGVCSNTGQQVGIDDYCSYGTWFGEKMGERAQQAVAKEHLHQIKVGAEKRMSRELIDLEAALMELCLDCLKSSPGKHGCHNPCHAYLSITDLPATEAVEVGKDNVITINWHPASEPPKEWRDDKTGHMIDYLAYSQADGVTYLANWFEPGKRWLVDGESVAITHWMPLPEGPKEDEYGKV